MTSHIMFDGKLQVYQRPTSRVWQCAARVGGKRHRKSTEEENFSSAKKVAEEWYLGLRGQLAAGIIVPKTKERTFGDAAKAYMAEVSVLAISCRSPKYVEFMELRMNRHILPYFGSKTLPEINKGLVQSYRVKRTEETMAKTGKPPARSTMLQEIVHIRQVLKFAEGKGWIPFVPSLETPYLTQTKRGRRAWFSPDEYKQLYEATRRRIKEGKRPGWKSHYEDMHDYVLFMGNTGLRPDEAANLEIRDVVVVDDYATRKTILEIDVRGKVGTGYAKSMDGAVYPFERLRARRRAELEGKHPNETTEQIDKRLALTKLFRPFDRDMFNKILDEEGLKFDRDGQRRTAYSLRHTYISSRLMEGASIHMVANNCRTSVQMIEEHYAAHIKDRIDAAAINVMRPKRQRKAAMKNDARRAADNGAHLTP
jgi:integrase